MPARETNEKDCAIEECSTAYINQIGGSAMYNIFLLQGNGKVSVDLVEYTKQPDGCIGACFIFSSLLNNCGYFLYL